MIQKFDHATLKVWFAAGHTSRNFSGVTEMERPGGNVLIIRNNSGSTYTLNWDNISMIEEIYNE